MRKLINLTGMKFGRLTVLGFSHRVRFKCGKVHVKWRTVCECGKEQPVDGGQLKQGNTQSCGCLMRERTSAANSRHRKSKTSEYAIWSQMRRRCSERGNVTEKSFYFDRGIRVCGRWEKFENFLSDMGERPSIKHSLERMDNNGPYSPENCKWATRTEQTRNTRRNVYITMWSQRRCASEWSQITGIKQATLTNRIKLGWTDEEALLTPVRPCGR